MAEVSAEKAHLSGGSEPELEYQSGPDSQSETASEQSEPFPAFIESVQSKCKKGACGNRSQLKAPKAKRNAGSRGDTKQRSATRHF